MLTAFSVSRGSLGRFGNTAFTLAGTIGIAIKSGQPYGFDRWRTVDNAIFGDPVDDIEQYLVNELPRIPDGLQFQDYGHYFWGYHNIFLPTGNWNIHGHCQSYKFFEHCISTIREVFRFKDEPPQNDYVAIHYRAGDYIDDPEAQHPRCSKEYYEKAMALFSKDTVFFVYTDDQQAWLDKMGSIENVIVRSCNTTYIEDFKAMKKCKSFICSNSSLIFMAALLGEHPDKKIIMPSRWFGSQMPPEFDTKDIYPQEAIVI